MLHKVFLASLLVLLSCAARYEEGKLKTQFRGDCMGVGATARELALGHCGTLLLYSTALSRQSDANAALYLVCVSMAEHRDNFYQHCGEESDW